MTSCLQTWDFTTYSWHSSRIAFVRTPWSPSVSLTLCVCVCVFMFLLFYLCKKKKQLCNLRVWCILRWAKLQQHSKREWNWNTWLSFYYLRIFQNCLENTILKWRHFFRGMGTGSAFRVYCFFSQAYVCVLALHPVKLRGIMSWDSSLPVITLNIFFPHTQCWTSTNDCKFD